MPLCPVCFQPECSESTGSERPPASTHSTRLEPGERDYRGYIDWAVHPDEARFVLHRGYAIVNGGTAPVYFDHNEAYVTQIQVVGSGSEILQPVVMLADSPGTIALPTAEMGRFLLFTIPLAGTNQPPGCYLNATASASVTENLNHIFSEMREEDEWVWIMGDDHCWPSMALVDMLRTMDRHPEIDVLVPLVVKRNPPWHLVIFHETDFIRDDGTPALKPYKWEEIPAPGNDPFEIESAGSAGMLVRRHVIEAVSPPWFFSTMDADGRQVILNEDVSFCHRIRHEYGFRIFATSDVVLGHLGIFNVRPMHNGERWGALTEFSSMDDKFRHVFMPVESNEPALT